MIRSFAKEICFFGSLVLIQVAKIFHFIKILDVTLSSTYNSRIGDIILHLNSAFFYESGFLR
jgi:hypothetical protein